MGVAVIGGGIQGCAAALALAADGHDVRLLEAGSHLFNEESLANVGRVHLGFHYACDPSLDTARNVQPGAVAFAPLLRRWLGDAFAQVVWSLPYRCAIAPDSLVPYPDYVDYARALEGVVADVLAASPFAEESEYSARLFRELEPGELDGLVNPDRVAGAIECAERSVDPLSLGTAMAAAIAAHPSIEVLTGHRVTAIERRLGGYRLDHDDQEGGGHRTSADAVVNAAGIGREWLDAGAGHPDVRRRNHRLKGIARMPLPASLVGAPPIWFGMGNYGVLCSYGGPWGAMTYLPVTVFAESDASSAPRDWESVSNSGLPSDEERAIGERMATGLSAYIPALAAADMSQVSLAFGEVECNAGATDDPRSPDCGSHRRTGSGVRELADGYYSIETGKLTLAPLHARELADRVSGRG